MEIKSAFSFYWRIKITLINIWLKVSICFEFISCAGYRLIINSSEETLQKSFMSSPVKQLKKKICHSYQHHIDSTREETFWFIFRVISREYQLIIYIFLLELFVIMLQNSIAEILAKYSFIWWYFHHFVFFQEYPLLIIIKTYNTVIFNYTQMGNKLI